MTTTYDEARRSLILAVESPESAIAAKGLRDANALELLKAAVSLAASDGNRRFLEVAAAELARDPWRGGNVIRLAVRGYEDCAAEFVEVFAQCPTIGFAEKVRVLRRASASDNEELAGRAKLALAALEAKRWGTAHSRQAPIRWT